MMLVLLVCCLVYTVTVSALKLNLTTCPSPILDTWKEYDDRCQQESLSRRFHCQYDASEDMLFSACAVASKCGPGTHALIDTQKETVSCVSCSDEFYQQKGKMSYEYTQPNCDYKKNPCAEGKFQCETSSSQQDYKCSCDHQKGYVPNNPTDCDCFRYDSICDCQYKPCADGQQLAANYSCVAVPATATTPREPTTMSRPAGDSSNTGAIVGSVLGLVAVIIILAIICCCLRKRKEKILNKMFPGCSEKTDTPDSSKMFLPQIMSDKDKHACPTAPPAENSDDQHTGGQTAQGPSERSQSDEGQSEKTPIVAEEESTVDRSRDKLAVGTSAGESVMRDTEITVAENRMKERLKEWSVAPIQHGGFNINAKNVIVGQHGAIVEQQGTMPTENNFHNLQMDMPCSYISQTYPKDVETDCSQTYPIEVEIEPSDAASEDSMHEDDTEMKQPFIEDKTPEPGRNLQNGIQSLLPSPV